VKLKDVLVTIGLMEMPVVSGQPVKWYIPESKIKMSDIYEPIYDAAFHYAFYITRRRPDSQRSIAGDCNLRPRLLTELKFRTSETQASVYEDDVARFYKGLSAAIHGFVVAISSTNPPPPPPRDILLRGNELVGKRRKPDLVLLHQANASETHQKLQWFQIACVGMLKLYLMYAIF